MGCKKKFIFKLLQFPFSIGFALLGCVLFACSHAIYVRDKTHFYFNHPLLHFEEGIIVKFLDIIGCALFVMPLVLPLGNLVARRIKHKTLVYSDEITVKSGKWCRYHFRGIIIIIGIGIAMGVLFPAGRDPFVPKSSAVAMRGQNLYRMITQNNMRHDMGGKWFDPQKCSNSVEFIMGILSVSEADRREWCRTDEGVALWNVAIDVPEDCGAFFPVLISANFNLMLLESAIDDDAQLPIGLASGASLSLLDDKAIILVRKNGSSQVIKAKHCTRKNILNAQCGRSASATYLTPEGKITISVTTGSAIVSPQKQ